MTRMIRIAAVSVVVASLLCATDSLAQGSDTAFKEGLEARAKSRWEDAAAAMRRAIQTDDREAPRKVRRGGFIRLGGESEYYLPHYFLGEALFRLQQCAGAVTAWSISERQGVVAVEPQYVAAMQKGKTSCAQRGVLLDPEYYPLLSRTREHLTAITELASSVAARTKNKPDVLRGELGSQYERALTELQKAHDALAVATRSRLEREFGEAIAAADSADALIKRVDVQVTALLDVDKTSGELFAQIQTLLDKGEARVRALDVNSPSLAGQTPLLATRQRLGDAFARLRSQVSGARGNLAVLKTHKDQVDELTTELDKLESSVAQIGSDIRNAKIREQVVVAEQAMALVANGFEMLESRVAQAREPLTTELFALREDLIKQGEMLQRRWDAALRPPTPAALQDVTRRAEELRVKLAEVVPRFGRPLTRVEIMIPPELADGVRQFFAGAYQQTLDTLDLSRLQGKPYQEHVHLFRAAALHALFVRDGARDAAKRQQVVQEIEHVKQRKSGLVPDARAFGPSFIAFFKAVPATPASEPSSPQQ